MKRRWILASICLLALVPCHAIAAPVARLEVYPSERILKGPANRQQLAVIAHFADGARRDVTALTTFTSCDPSLASVDRRGRVHFHKTGEVAIDCRYQINAAAKLIYVAQKPGYAWPKPPVAGLIDHLVFQRLELLELAPSDLCEDRVFLRRAYLDLCGVMPTPREVRRFLDDPHPLKRSRLIDELLERPEFAAYWAHHWSEILPLTSWNLSTRDSGDVLRWFRAHLRKNTPLDVVARELILGAEIPVTRGSRGFYSGARTPAEWAERTSAAFLGVRMDCANCHPHPRMRLTADDRHQFIAFFSQVVSNPLVMERHRFDRFPLDFSREWVHPQTRKPVAPRFPRGATPKIDAASDRRKVLADWLTAPDNPYFARTMANRIWYQLFGRGIAHPPEIIHELPMSANDALLDALARGFVNERFDVKQLIRSIMNSRTYQLGATPNEFNKDDDRYFSRVYPGRVREDLLIDLVSQFTEVDLPVDDLPPGTRAIDVIRMPIFFGWGRQRVAECERESIEPPNLAANLHFLNSDMVQKALRHPGNRVARLLYEKKTDTEIVDELFLASVTRLPTPHERELIRRQLVFRKTRAEAYEDIAWALMNTSEFVMRR